MSQASLQPVVDPDRWTQIKTIFAGALERPPADQTRFVAAACASDPALRREVESLLASHKPEDDFITPPVLTSLERAPMAGAEGLIGRRIGAYEIERVIGVGGMGVVYLASRADEQFTARVAIKLIRREAVTNETMQRFLHERQTLANLNHPNIARLMDGGVTQDGFPYQILEYVEGVAIDRYCDENRLNVSERLKLFLVVCAAVHHAHQRLVVHRDLKPGNILVGPDGMVKLLDFGIARVLNASESEASTRIMTPAYASPEQIRGEGVTTATDVYSLGVVLYELLTSRRPYRLTSKQLPDIARLISECQPDKPSTAVMLATPRGKVEQEPAGRNGPTVADRRGESLARVRRRLAGDLDAIVLRAMHKDAKLRYPSVESLAADVQRHLDLRPVSVRRATPAYVISLWTRRNRLAAIMTGAAILSLVGGIITTSWWARVAMDERDQAVKNQKRAEHQAEAARVEVRKLEQVTKFFEKLLGGTDPGNGNRAEIIVGLLSDAAARVKAEYGSDPEVESAVRSAIAENYFGLGLFDEAEAQFRMALRLQDDIHRLEIHSDVARHQVRLAELLLTRGRTSEARELLERALAIYRRLPESAVEAADLAQRLSRLDAGP
jgi:serine/threonine protein kinase